MSLQVWLPLNGHTKNYGLSDATASLMNNPSIVASNRGECYNLNPNNENSQAIELKVNDMPLWVKNEFSVAFWVYHRETADRSIIFGSHALNGAYNFNIEKVANSNALRVYMEEKPDLSIGACILPVNTWTHIVVTKSATELNVYKNGIKVYTRTHASTDLWKSSDSVIYRLGRDNRNDSTALNGMLSDFRIYDHVLSQKEIKVLSQGLLLNYSFDDLYMTATTNLIDKTDGSFVKNASSAWHAGLACPKTYITPGKTYTFSCEVRHTGSQSYTVYFDTNCTDEGGVYSGNDAAMQNIKSNSGTIIPKDGSWVKAWVTVTIKSDASKPYIHHTLCPQVSAEEVTFYYRNVQLEEGSIPTPYVPHGLPRDGQITDNSGWGRHGQLKTSSCYVSTDTPLGEYSLHLNGSDAGDKACVVGNLNLDDIKTYTFSTYIKINTWGKQNSGLFNAEYNSSSTPGNYYTSPLHHRDSCFDIAVKNNTTATIGATYQRLSCASDIILGQWTHVAVTFNGQIATLYIDGIKKRTVSFNATVTLAPCKYIFLSYSYAGGVHRVTNANWSDFRVYSTCLSDDDIKKLAFNHVAIDKKNNLHCYELVEEIGIEHNIAKQSVVNVGVKEEVNIYPGSQFNAASMNVTYNFATDVFKDYGFNTCTKFAASNTSTSAFLAYSYLLPTSYYTPGSAYSFACYAYVSPDCNANLRINLEQSTGWVKNYQGTKSNINDTTKGKVIKVTGTIKANTKGQIYIMFYPNPNQANVFTTGYFLIAGLTIVAGEVIPHPRVEKMSENLIQSMSPGAGMTANGTHSLIGDFSRNADTYGWFNTTKPLEVDRMYRLSFNVSNLTSGSIWDWRLWNNANYNIRVDRTGHFYYTFIVKRDKLPLDINFQKFLWDDGGRTNPTGSVYFNDFKLVECIAQPYHGFFETNKSAIHSSYIEMNNIYED